MVFWPRRRRPDDLLRVMQRLESRVSGMEHRILSLTQRSEHMASQFDQLAQDVSDVTAAETGAEGRVAAEVAALQAEIDQLKTTNPDIAPQLAGLEAVKARLAALAQPQAPAPTPTPSPTPEPTPAPTPQPTPVVQSVPPQGSETPPAAPDQGQGPVGGGQAGT